MDPELELLMMQLAANQYGSGPDYMSSEQNPYQRPQQRLNYWQDIESLIGVPLTQLAGVGEAPPEQGEAPNIFQSDLQQAYGSNPVFRDAFDLIQNGVDPYKAMASVRAAYEAGDYGDAASQLVPVAVDDFTKQESVDWDEVGSVIQQYATDNARTSREMEQYQSENSPQFTQAAASDGARYKNAPLGGNDPFAFANEADLIDFQGIEQDFARKGQQYRESLNFVGGRPGGATPFGAVEQTELGGELEAYIAGKTGKKETSAGSGSVTGQQTRMSQTARVLDQQNPNTFHDSRPPRDTSGVRRQRAQAERNDSLGGSYSKSLQANLTNRKDRAAKTAVRSDANTNAMKRLMAAYALINGELPR